MTARAESILGAVKSAVSGLITTGANVQRGQVYEHQAADLPALAVFMGQDVPVGDFQTGLVDWELTVVVESTLAINPEYTAMESGAETEINRIREEVHAAILGAPTFGLSYVIDTRPGIASRPALNGNGADVRASQSLEFVIHYRTSRADIGA